MVQGTLNVSAETRLGVVAMDGEIAGAFGIDLRIFAGIFLTERVAMDGTGDIALFAHQCAVFATVLTETLQSARVGGGAGTAVGTGTHFGLAVDECDGGDDHQMY